MITGADDQEATPPTCAECGGVAVCVFGSFAQEQCAQVVALCRPYLQGGVKRQ